MESTCITARLLCEVRTLVVRRAPDRTASPARTLRATCRRLDLHQHYMASETTDSAVGLRRQETKGARAAGRIRTVTAWPLRPLTLPLVYGGISFVGALGLAPSCPRRAVALQASSVSLPSTLPWGDRRDSHPLVRGPHPRASTTSASITVCPGRLARPSIAYRATTLLLS